MNINDSIATIVEGYRQTIDGVIELEIGKSLSLKVPIMPETIMPIYDLELAKCSSVKTNILEKWLEVLGSPKGIANEIGRLRELIEIFNNELPELHRLEADKNAKKKLMDEAWNEYQLHADPNPFENQYQ